MTGSENMMETSDQVFSSTTETAEQAPPTERERMMLESDSYAAKEISERMNKDAVLSSMAFSSPLDK